MKAGVSFKEITLLQMEGWGRHGERYATEMRKTHSIPAVY
jgi:hypothetical protein